MRLLHQLKIKDTVYLYLNSFVPYSYYEKKNNDFKGGNFYFYCGNDVQANAICELIMYTSSCG